MMPEKAYEMSSMPCNSLPFIKRVKEILYENHVNNFDSLPESEKDKVEGCFFILLSQFYGQLFQVDSMDVFKRLQEKHETIYKATTKRMDLSGIETIPMKRIKDSGLTKEDIAKQCIPKDITFDYALPQPWLDAFSDYSSYSYHEILGTTFTLYSDDRNIRGFIFSACAEISD